MKKLAGAAATVVALAGLTACTTTEPPSAEARVGEFFETFDELTAGSRDRQFSIIDDRLFGEVMIRLENVDRSYIQHDIFMNDAGETCWNLEFEGPEGELPDGVEFAEVGFFGETDDVYATDYCSPDHVHVDDEYFTFKDALDGWARMDVWLTIETKWEV